MFMHVESQLPGSVVYPELAGTRVLMTGLQPTLGVDVARALADHGARLALQSPGVGEEMTEILALLAQTADETKHYEHELNTPSDAKAFAQGPAMQAFGGLDMGITFTAFTEREIAGLTTAAEIEDLVSQKLAIPLLLGRVLANRMRLTLTQGHLLNVVTLPAAFDGRATGLAGLVRTALAAMTRGEASEWAPYGIRINAVGPASSPVSASSIATDDDNFTSEADIAALTLFLASGKAEELTGHVFDPAGLVNGRTLQGYV